MANKATLEALEALHCAVAEVLAKGLTACEPELVQTDEGKNVLEGYDARLVGQAMAFLKDNDITVDHDTGPATNEVAALIAAKRARRKTSDDPFADIPHH